MPKILVIEDMPESAEMTAQILRRYGHDVWVAASAVLGLSLAAEHEPDLIVCDYWLPDLEASTFLARLRSSEALKDIKVGFLHSCPSRDYQKKLGRSGIPGFYP